jgi:CubicO group peptidase (beta-lactamase class C family)
MQDWKVPGLSIVIVKDGKIAYMKGFGVRNIDTKEPVDENTLFMIASNTKLFTGTALSLLEYRNKLSLNDKITKYFPDYRLYDSAATQLVTIRDLLSHHLGTKTFQGDFTFWNTKLNRGEIIRRMRYLKPNGQFRQDYGYCNSCFLAAGEVIPRVTRQPWEVFVYDSIVIPLDMHNTHMMSAGISERKNVATPYTTAFVGKLTPVEYDQWDNLGPAASIISCVSDLSHWLMFQLDSGRYNNKQVLPFAVLQRTRDVNTIVSSRKSAIYPVHMRGYGLGVFTSDYNGRQIYFHTGGAGGMVSNVCFVPEEKLGIAILTNNDNQNFFETLRYQILDAYLGVPYVNRSQQQLPGFMNGESQQMKQIAEWKTRVKGNNPALPLSAYVGEYAHELYGKINISQQQNKLVIQFGTHPNLIGTLDYMDKDEWLLQFNNIEFGIFPIRFNVENGKVVSVPIKVNDFVEFDPYIFVKK